MPIAPTCPGVYIEEVPSGVHAITGVATSIAAFVDRFERGPQNVAVRITSFADFERVFGGLDPASAASYGIQQFFLNGGADAYVVRTVAATPAPGGTSPQAAELMLSGGGANVLRVRAGVQIHGESVLNPGAWGNGLRLEIDYDTARLPNSAIDPFNELKQEELFNLTVSEVEVRDGKMTVLQTETYRNITLHDGVRMNALSVVNAASRLVQLELVAALPAPPAPAPRPDPTGTVGVSAPDPLPLADRVLRMDVDPDGTGGAGVVTVPARLSGIGAITTLTALRAVLEAALRGAANDPAATERVRPLLAGASVQLVNGAFRVLLGREGRSFDPDATIGFKAPDADALGLSAPAAAPRAQMLSPTTLGADGDPPGAQDLVGSEVAKSGMHALDDVSLFNILCVPAAAEQATNDMRTVYAAATVYCQQRRAFLLIDVPRTTADPDAMQKWLSDNASLRHRNTAVYFPRVQVPDPLDQNRLQSRGASGTIAGVFAATDVARGVWKAPAGTEARLRNVQALDYVLTDRENGILNSHRPRRREHRRWLRAAQARRVRDHQDPAARRADPDVRPRSGFPSSASFERASGRAAGRSLVFEGLLSFEKVLAVLGIIFFAVLLLTFVAFVFQKRSVTGLLPFFVVQVVMIGFPGIQKVSYDHGKIELETALTRAEQNPNDRGAQDQLRVAVNKVAPRASDDAKTNVLVAKAFKQLGQPQRALEHTEAAVRKDPNLLEAHKLQTELRRELPHP